MTSVSGGLKWYQLCRLLDRVKAAKRPTKKELLCNFMASYRDELAKLKQKGPQSEESFFPVLRVLLPALDKDRGAYGVKERKLAELYIRILGIKKEAPDAVKLINYRKPKTAGGAVAGDFAEVAFYVLKNRCPAEGRLTLQEVDDHLTSIAVNHAAKQHDAVTDAMLLMLRAMSAMEQKWLIRVLLKDMQLGVGQTVIFAAWHPDAKDYYDVNNSLNKVCSTLRDPNVRLHEVGVSLFSPFRPMLAERAVLEKVEKQMKHKTFIAENKFDGERSQIHKQGDKYMYFSRNGFDFTSNFGGSPSSGLLTPELHALLQPHVQEVILDGEVVCWHKQHEVIITKGEHHDVKNLRPDGPLQVCFCAFDLLLLNGRVLTNLPLRERKEMLAAVLMESPGRVILSSHEEVQDKAAVVRALNAAIDRREEGLVLKDPDSVYRPAARAAGWIKVKPEYVDSLVPELDLLIIGGFYGAGRLHGVVSHFLLAVADTDTITDGGRVTRVTSICRVGSGYTDDELSALSARLAPHSSTKCPDTVLAFSKDKPHVWFNPANSVVVQVRAAEVSTTKSYGASLTLRFPRVEAIRSDKSWQDILTTVQLQQLHEEGQGKLAVHHYTDEGAADGAEKGGARATRLSTRQAALPLHFTPADLSGIKQTSRVLASREVCVLDGGGGLNKQQLEQKVAEAGGSVTQHPSSSTFCVISAEYSVRCNNLAAAHSIVKPEWLIRCIKAGQLLPWGPLDAVSLLPRDRERVALTHDQFGDSYEHDVDSDDLTSLLENMHEDNMDGELVTREEMAEMQDALMEFDEPYNLFAGVTALMVDQHGTPTLKGEMTQLQVRQHGGSVENTLGDVVTHLICCSPKCSLSWEQCKGRHLVTEDWVLETIKRSVRAEERRYTPALLSS